MELKVRISAGDDVRKAANDQLGRKRDHKGEHIEFRHQHAVEHTEERTGRDRQNSGQNDRPHWDFTDRQGRSRHNFLGFFGGLKRFSRVHIQHCAHNGSRQGQHRTDGKVDSARRNDKDHAKGEDAVDGDLQQHADGIGYGAETFGEAINKTSTINSSTKITPILRMNPDISNFLPVP